MVVMEMSPSRAVEAQDVVTDEARIKAGRRRLFMQAGAVLGAGSALAAIALPAAAAGKEEAGEIDGVWESVISAADNSFAAFRAFNVYGGGLWIGSGQTDLTPAALSSSLWSVTRRIGPRRFHGVGRFWTYDANANPSGFASVDQITTISEDGRTYYGEGWLQFFDVDGKPLGVPAPLRDNATRLVFA